MNKATTELRHDLILLFSLFSYRPYKYRLVPTSDANLFTCCVQLFDDNDDVMGEGRREQVRPGPLPIFG